MRADSMMNNAQEKLKEIGADSATNNVQEWLKQLVSALANFGAYFIDWLDKVFPPETRSKQIHHWLHVAALFLTIAFILFIFVKFLSCCCRCFCCCGRTAVNTMSFCGRNAVKMMKAPGREYLMPRHVFESNPASYFRALRS